MDQDEIDRFGRMFAEAERGRTAEGISEEIAAKARQRYQREARFRMMVESVVSQVMRDYGPMDPERPYRDASVIAVEACTLLLECVFTEDAELNAQRELAERYRKIAEDVLGRSPMPPMFGQPQKDLRHTGHAIIRTDGVGGASRISPADVFTKPV